MFCASVCKDFSKALAPHFGRGVFDAAAHERYDRTHAFFDELYPSPGGKAVKRRLFFFAVLVFASCLDVGGCPAAANGSCQPRSSNCPHGYFCSLAEICTKACEKDSDCLVNASGGCYSDPLPGMRLSDGGVATGAPPADGICPESKSLVCLSLYCQSNTCPDAGCDYDVYGPSPFKSASK